MMKRIFAVLTLALGVEAATAQKYEADWASINAYPVPEWAIDAKFGLYATWGPYALIGSWEDNNTYPTNGNYYTTGYQGIYSKDEYDMRRVTFENRYGSIKDGAGYYDICKDFTVKGFDPVEWAELALESGAKYAGACAVHHDGYLLWDSEVTTLDAMDTGAKRDIIGELFTELEKRGLKTIATFHHARTKHFFGGFVDRFSKDKDYAGLDLLQPDAKEKYWAICSDEEFHERELQITNELINKYKPDVIWFDGGATNNSKDVIATFLNMGVENKKEVVLHNKDRMFGDDFGLYSYERGYLRPHSLLHHPWEDDETSCVSGSWCWWHGINYKPYSDIIKRLCHLTAINGGLLLSLNVRPDGSFDPEMVAQLKGIGKWMKQNGEAINGTRPWMIQGEGNMDELSLRYVWSKGMQYRYATPNVTMFRSTDFRFTSTPDAIYALQLGIPSNGVAKIISMSKKNRVSSEDRIESIELLGHGKVDFVRTDDALIITLPKELPNGIVLAYKIKVKGKISQIRTYEDSIGKKK